MVQIFEEVRKLVAKMMEIEKWQVTMDSAIENDLGVYELDLIEIIMEIEKEFDINLEDLETDEVKTIKYLIEKIQEKIEKKCKEGLKSKIKVI